ncbi:MAG: glycosyltransferase [Planctomycetota bacterium]|nr:glycosyltransferase [Planctomycetota bacterium]
MGLRIVLIAIGSGGDVNPVLGIASRLRDRGHDVLFCTNPHFRRSADELGLAFEAIGAEQEYLDATLDTRLWNPMRGLEVVASGVVATLERTRDLAREALRGPGPGVVVSAALGMGARLERDLSSFPLVTLQLAPSALVSVDQPPRLLPGVDLRRVKKWFRRVTYAATGAITDWHLRAINHRRRELGLARERRLLLRWANSPDRVLGLWPAWFGPVAPDWPAQLRLTGFATFDGVRQAEMAPDVDAFIARHGPPVVFAPGTANRFAGGFFAAGLEACARLKRPALMLTPFGEQVPQPLPGARDSSNGDAAMHARYVPLAALLPRCAALVHHGGIGTTARGFGAGVPQVVCPMAFDQFDNAERAMGLGAARVVAWREVTAQTLESALGAVLGNAHLRDAANELAHRVLAHDGIHAAADEIEAMGGRAGLQA